MFLNPEVIERQNSLPFETRKWLLSEDRTNGCAMGPWTEPSDRLRNPFDFMAYFDTRWSVVWHGDGGVVITVVVV
jgi:hypothetical protein